MHLSTLVDKVTRLPLYYCHGRSSVYFNNCLIIVFQMVQRMKRELRQKIESEIKELQQCLDREEDVAHFRELDAQNVRHKLSRMTFTTTVK